MEITALIILILSGIVGFACIFFTNFGTTIIIASIVLYAVITKFSIISIPVLLVLITLYLCGEVFEYIFIVIGAKKFGASNKAIIGAIIGGIIGAVIGTAFFGIGLFIGTLLGIFLGAFIVEILQRKSIKQSLMAGAGGVFGRIGAIVAKVIISCIMFSIIIVYIIQNSLR